MAMFRSETPCTTASMTPGLDLFRLCLPLLLLHGNSAPKYISFRIPIQEKIKKKLNMVIVFHLIIFIPELGCVGEGDRQYSREYLCCTRGAPEFP